MGHDFCQVLHSVLPREQVGVAVTLRLAFWVYSVLMPAETATVLTEVLLYGDYEE